VIYAVLSPAKSLHDLPEPVHSRFSEPALLGHAEHLMDRSVRKLSSKQLQKLMGISAKLGELNHERNQAFGGRLDLDNARQAADLFAGDTYIGFDGHTLDDAGVAYAQEHVGILSGLYGLLRPFDLIQPYRLEMGTKLKNPRGKDLYAYWRGAVTGVLSERLGRLSDPLLVNLASNEYFRAVDPKVLGVPVVTPSFLERKDGKARPVSFFAKRARGRMARWIVDTRAETARDLLGFDVAGYRLDADRSEPAAPVFVRDQPAPGQG